MEIGQLQKGAAYRVCQDFSDFYNHSFVRGETLTFIEYHFLPYHGGYTLVFQERRLYLQEDENVQILRALEDYLCLVEE